VLEERVDAKIGLEPANVLYAIQSNSDVVTRLYKKPSDLLGGRCKRGKGSKTETVPCYEGPRRCTNPLVSARAHAGGGGVQLPPRGRGGSVAI
jgi:hypothetical protein